MQQAQQLQKQMMKMQEELETATVEATAGGGVVKATVSGKMRIESLTIDPEGGFSRRCRHAGRPCPGRGQRGPAEDARHGLHPHELPDRRHEHPGPDLGGIPPCVFC